MVNDHDGVIQQDAAQACAKDLMTLPVLKVSGRIWHFTEWLVDFEAYNPTGDPVICLHLATFFATA